MLTVQEIKDIMSEEKVKREKAIERELAYKKELDDDKAVLTYVQNLVDTGESLPPDCPYESFTEWVENAKKEIKTDEASITRIDKDKKYLDIINYYMEKATVENA